jgi:hypothetical protein
MAIMCLTVFRCPLFVYDPQTLAHAEHTCLYAWLEKVASYATDAYLFEEVLIHKLQEASCAPSPVTTLDRVLFVVMCSSDKKERVSWLTQTWLAWVPPRNVVLLSDTVIPGYNVTLLPSLPGDAYVKTKFPNPNNYDAANLRHLLSVQWLGKVNEEALDDIDWVFMVDDDTFVNLPMLLSLVRQIPPSLPLVVGHMWDSPPWDNQLKGVAWPSGGAGMLFTKAGFHRLALNLFEPVCDMRRCLNDVTIGLCATASKVTKIHSDKFQTERIETSSRPLVRDAGVAVTVHRVIEWQHAIDYTCLVSKRFNWSHPLCDNVSVPCDPVCHMEHTEMIW